MVVLIIRAKAKPRSPDCGIGLSEKFGSDE
jgi:hypothetical protein